MKQRFQTSFRRFSFGLAILVLTTFFVTLFFSHASFNSIPLKATMSIKLTNDSDENYRTVQIQFRVLDYQNKSRIGFFNSTFEKIQYPNGTLVGPMDVDTGFTILIPEWKPDEMAQIWVDNIRISNDFPLDFSSLGNRPIIYDISNVTYDVEYSLVLSIVGKTLIGTQSISSLHHFSYNDTVQLETRIQTGEFSKTFFLFLYFLVLLVPFYIWNPKSLKKLPLATFTLVLLMICIYAFIGSGREISGNWAPPWGSVSTFLFGTFMHVSDSHIYGNLITFFPLSIFLEVWLNVKEEKHKFIVWYLLPISFAVFFDAPILIIGFSIANEFLAWALWSLVIVNHKTKTKLDLLLCFFSGLTALTFFGWLQDYLTRILYSQTSSWLGHEGMIHVLLGLIGALIYTFVTVYKLRARKREKDQN